jgi:hypothetical protein
MEIKENPRVKATALKYMREKYLTPKPFPHVAELIYCLTKSYFDRTDPIPPQDNEVLLFAIGFGLEKVMLPKDYESKSKQIDGIYYTPDLVLEGETTEIKTTRMKYTEGSIKVPETWLQQTKSYCHCENTNSMNLAILHITGNYRPPFPLVAGYTVHFTNDELENNWKYILFRKGVLADAIGKSIMPAPYSFCQIEWECEHCRYKLRCQSLSAMSNEVRKDESEEEGE